jgi:hypothetical protein
MEINADRSASKAPILEPLRLSGFRLFPFIPLTLTKEKFLKDLMSIESCSSPGVYHERTGNKTNMKKSDH